MNPIEESKIVFVKNNEDVQEYFRWLGERRNWLAFDTETGGLEFWKQPLRLVQVGDTATAYVFRADRWLGVVEESLLAYEGPLVGQNVGFDHRFLDFQAGIRLPWGNLHDTKVMAHAIDPTKSTSLPNEAFSRVSVPVIELLLTWMPRLPTPYGGVEVAV